MVEESEVVLGHGYFNKNPIHTGHTSFHSWNIPTTILPTIVMFTLMTCTFC